MGNDLMFEQVLLTRLQQRTAQVIQLIAENAELKKQLEQLKAQEQKGVENG